MKQTGGCHCGKVRYEVEMNVAKGRLIIAPRPPRHYHLADLVAEIRPGNLHKEIVVQGPQGKEVW